ncbi:hypothetical protein [Silvimonas iriomotensis]|uniref:Uncharacterized protein n=1 Tax=Silvimonas iriomotensis TaxID=449662 RepID=A0ABQ2PEH7_9NEIS|nr:hypothetical protein [Silvimonas iriomotensis]GGP23967.1 hypothetical protein GCM10010970_39670 [Silvimonas iriomotensis]
MSISIGPVTSATAATTTATAKAPLIAPTPSGDKPWGDVSVWSPTNPGTIANPVWVPGDQAEAWIQQQSGGTKEYADYVLSVASPNNSQSGSARVALSFEAWSKQQAELKDNPAQSNTANIASLNGSPQTYDFKQLIGAVEGESAGKVASSIDAMKSKLDSAYLTETRKKHA